MGGGRDTPGQHYVLASVEERWVAFLGTAQKGVRMSKFNIITGTSQDPSPPLGANFSDQEESDFSIPKPAHKAGRLRKAQRIPFHFKIRGPQQITMYQYWSFSYNKRTALMQDINRGRDEKNNLDVLCMCISSCEECNHYVLQICIIKMKIEKKRKTVGTQEISVQFA